MEHLGQNGKMLSIYEIGVIEYKVKQLLQLTTVFDMLKGDYVETIDYRGKCYSVKSINPIDVAEMRSAISNVLNIAIESIKSEVISLIEGLGYTDTDGVYSLLLSRLSMFFTLLRTGEKDYNIIII